MENYFSIKQISNLTGISEYTLRYYEKNGLIHFICRDSKGRRQYSEKDLGWIQFLMKLRTTGMSIRQMQEIAELRKLGPTTSKERRLLLEAHKQKLAENIKKLQEHMEALDTKIKDYRKSELEIEEQEEKK